MAFATLEIRRAREARDDIESAVSRHRRWYIVQAVVFMLAGILAMALPSATAIGLELLIGVLLLISGAVQGYISLRSRLHVWALVSSVASLVVGILMLFNPMAGTIALATVLAIFLLIEGIVELLLAFEFRPMRFWGWLAFSGFISLVLAALLFAGWPDTTVLFLGVVIGINLLLYGLALLFLTWAVKPAS